MAESTWKAAPLADRLESAGVLAAVSDSLPGNDVTRKTSDYWRWKHVNTPFGRSTGTVALSDADEEVVGVRSFMRWTLSRPTPGAGTGTLGAVRAVDTVTNDAWRGKGIFKRLTFAAIEDLEREGVDLIFNTPNQNSAPGYRKMGWQCVGAVPLFIRPVRPLRMALRVLRRKSAPAPTWSASEFKGLPLWRDVPDLDAVLALVRSHEAARPATGLRTQRTAEYLAWRYGAHPQAEYRVYLHREAGRLVGAAVLRANVRLGLKELVLTELWAEGADSVRLKQVVQGVCAATDCDHVMAHFAAGSVELTAIRRCFFLPVRQQKMRLFARGLGKPLPADVFSMTGWDLSLGDLELF